MSISWTFRFAALLALTALAAGCSQTSDRTINTTIHSDYALFQVENDQAQRNDVAVTLNDVEPGSQYVLFFAPDAPHDTGWFQFDPSQLQTCGSMIGPHCEAPGYGYMVDVLTAQPGQTSLTLRDERSSHDIYDDDPSWDAWGGDPNDDAWTGRWAVMRIVRTDADAPVTFHVQAIAHDDDLVDPPTAKQLQ